MDDRPARLEWWAVPPAIRAEVGDALGSPIIEAVSQPGGFSPGPAARCRLADGRRCFVKAASSEHNPTTPLVHLREAAVSAALPGGIPVPALLAVIEADPWVAIVFEDIDGVCPPLPWTLDNLSAALSALEELARALTPSPIPWLPTMADHHRDEFRGFRTLADHGPIDRLDPWTAHHLHQLAELEARWEVASGGPTLLHADLRADNMLIRPDGTVTIVDWPHACTGAAWVDVVCMLPAVGLAGGPSPTVVERELDPFGSAEPESVDAMVAAVAGYFTARALEPAVPGIPTLRSFQAAQSRVALEWLRNRVDGR